MLTSEEMYKYARAHEINELVSAVKSHGKYDSVQKVYRYEFPSDFICVIVGYDLDQPTDLIVTAVEIDPLEPGADYNKITVYAKTEYCETEYCENEYYTGDILFGQLIEITKNIE